MRVGLRTPAEVIALSIEDAGITPFQAREIAEDAAKRLARCLNCLSNQEASHILWADKQEGLNWGHVKSNYEEP